MSPALSGCHHSSNIVYQTRLRSTQEEPTVSLFSFNPGLSLNGLAIPPWPKNPYQGWVRFFEGVHSCFAQAALKRPKNPFIIKTKYDGIWHERIKEACSARSIDIRKIPNLILTSERSAHELILNSSVIVSCFYHAFGKWVSQKHIIIPDFDETKDSFYRKHI